MAAFLKITVIVPDKPFAPKSWREKNDFCVQMRFGWNVSVTSWLGG